jgi:hypothetical protein
LRNKIINGNFNVWQRAISFVSPATGAYLADRFAYLATTSAAITVTRETDVPSAVNANYSLKVNVTTADASIAAGDAAQITQPLEGYTLLPLKNKTVVLTFWVKSSLTGTYCISFRNTGNTRSLVKTYTISVANTWEQKTITLTHDSTGTWNYTSGIGMYVSWALMSGTTFQTTADTWQAGNFIATSAQVNFVGTVSNTFFLSQIQLEESPVVTGFEHRDFEQELRLCQRYYEKSVAHDIFAYTNESTAHSSVGGTTSDIATPTRFNVEKRASPSITVYAATSGTSGAVRNLTTAADLTSVSSAGNVKGFYVSKSASVTVSSWYAWNWTASAEL